MSKQLFLEYLLSDAEINVEIYNWIQTAMRIRPFKVSGIPPCKIKIDMIQLGDIDPGLVQYVSTSFCRLPDMIREYAKGVIEEYQQKLLSDKSQSQNDTASVKRIKHIEEDKTIVIRSEYMMIDIEIVNYPIISGMSMQRAKSALMKAQGQNEQFSGQLISIQNALVLKISDPEIYSTIRAYTCIGCRENDNNNKNNFSNYNSVIFKPTTFINEILTPTILSGNGNPNNIGNSVMQRGKQFKNNDNNMNGVQAPFCRCGDKMIEDSQLGSVDLCQKILLLVDTFERDNQSNNYNILKDQGNNNQENKQQSAYFKIQNQAKNSVNSDVQLPLFASPLSHQIRSRKVMELYLWGDKCNKLSLGQHATFLAYWNLTPSFQNQSQQQQTSVIAGFSKVSLVERLFCIGISQNNEHACMQNQQQWIKEIMESNQNVLNKITYHPTSNNSEEELHFTLKSLLFKAQMPYYNLSQQTEDNSFWLLGLKISLLLSFLVSTHSSNLSKQQNNNNNHKSLTSTDTIISKNNSLNVLFNCDANLFLPVKNLIIRTYSKQSLSFLTVFDASAGQASHTILLNAIMQAAGGVLLIVHSELLKQEHIHTVQKLLNNQPILLPKISQSLVIPITVWAIGVTVSGRKHFHGQQLSLNGNFFDIALEVDQTNTVENDFMKYLDIAAWELLQRENNHGKDFKSNSHGKGKKEASQVLGGNAVRKIDQEDIVPGSSEGLIEKQIFSTAKKRKPKNHLHNLLVESQQQSEEESPDFVNIRSETTDQIGSAGIRYQSSAKDFNGSATRAQKQESKEAYELMHAFVSKARALQTANSSYSLSNVDSLSKIAMGCSILRQDFNCKIDDRISLVDIFLAIILNVLSRPIFTQHIDVAYIHSYLLNYGLGYDHKQHQGVIPQEGEFYIALEKIQDMIADFIELE